MNKNTVLIVIIVLAAVVMVIWYGKRPDALIHNRHATTTPATTTTFSTTSEDFKFKYNTRWYLYDGLKSGVILLKTKEFPKIESEIFALGDFIVVNEGKLIGPYEKKLTQAEFITMITTEENVYEGKTTLSRWEKINGQDMFRVEHSDPNSQQTISYYLFKNGGYYQIYHYPYKTETPEEKQNYADFMNVVNTFTLIK